MARRPHAFSYCHRRTSKHCLPLSLPQFSFFFFLRLTPFNRNFFFKEFAHTRQEKKKRKKKTRAASKLKKKKTRNVREMNCVREGGGSQRHVRQKKKEFNFQFFFSLSGKGKRRKAPFGVRMRALIPRGVWDSTSFEEKQGTNKQRVALHVASNASLS